MYIPNIKIFTKDKDFSALMYKKDVYHFLINSFFYPYAIVWLNRFNTDTFEFIYSLAFFYAWHLFVYKWEDFLKNLK